MLGGSREESGFLRGFQSGIATYLLTGEGSTGRGARATAGEAKGEVPCWRLRVEGMSSSSNPIPWLQKEVLAATPEGRGLGITVRGKD